MQRGKGRCIFNCKEKDSSYSYFYGVVFVLLLICNIVAPGGPCAPGLALFLLLALPFVSVFLLVKNLYQPFSKEERNKAAALIHFLFCIIVIGYFLFLFF
jgi:hypothetical protein